MITLDLPRTNENLFALFQGGAIGPFDSTGLYQGDIITYRSRYDFLSQTRGIYNQNGVDHVEVNGSLKYEPLLGDLTRAPTEYDPEAMKWNTLAYTSKLPTTVTARFGRVVDRSASYGKSLFTALNRAWMIGNSNTIVYVEALANLSSPKRLSSLIETRFTYASTKNGVLTYNVQNTTFTFPKGYLDSSLDWTVKRSFDDILSMRDYGVPRVSQSTPITATLFWGKTPFQSSPAQVQTVVDSLIAQQLSPLRPVIEEKHYGELAQDASQAVNETNVNMISFVRDMRHPTEMIPKIRKLAELRSLKKLSNDYLTVNYGVLPTISDLKEIYSAFHKAKPYVDRNGFKTYGAGFSDSKKVDNVDFSLEQRIQLAIKDTDSELINLMNKIESIGFLPTAQNLWDLVPYSFVVDWFLGVGDYLESIDTSLRLMRFDIRYVTMSRKLTAKLTLQPNISFPYSGSVEKVHYQRWVSDQCPVPPLSLTTTFQGFSHWLESSALLIQRSKKLK